MKISKTWIVVVAILFVGCSQKKSERLTFAAGTYEVTAQGHNGDIRLSVTFSDSCITDIQVLEQHETPHIGDIVFDELIPQIIKANGTGVDAMTGATVTSRGLMAGVTEAANMAKVSDAEQFKKASLPKAEQTPVEGTWDVVIVGAGGAGLAAAAEAAQQGSTVLVIEKNAEIGGNTLVSGGIFQSVMPYLVWDPAHPDAKTGVGIPHIPMPRRVWATTERPMRRRSRGLVVSRTSRPSSDGTRRPSMPTTIKCMLSSRATSWSWRPTAYTLNTCPCFRR